MDVDFFYEFCWDIYFFFFLFFGEIYDSSWYERNIFLRLSFKEHLIVNFEETYLFQLLLYDTEFFC